MWMDYQTIVRHVKRCIPILTTTIKKEKRNNFLYIIYKGKLKMIEKPDMNNCTDKQWTKWWWQDYNELCKKCQKQCKQSWNVKLTCSVFKGVEVE
jgi:hypothetical protein